MRKGLKRVLSAGLCVAFAAALCPTVVAMANNSADTPYGFYLSYNQTGYTEQRAKLDDSYVYVKCERCTNGTPIVRAVGVQKGTEYSWSSWIPAGLGSEQFLTNYIWENRPETNVTAYCKLQFKNDSINRTIYTSGLWSPDSV